MIKDCVHNYPPNNLINVKSGNMKRVNKKRDKCKDMCLLLVRMMNWAHKRGFYNNARYDKQQKIRMCWY